MEREVWLKKYSVSDSMLDSFWHDEWRMVLSSWTRLGCVHDNCPLYILVILMEKDKEYAGFS